MFQRLPRSLSVTPAGSSFDWRYRPTAAPTSRFPSRRTAHPTLTLTLNLTLPTNPNADPTLTLTLTLTRPLTLILTLSTTQDLLNEHVLEIDSSTPDYLRVLDYAGMHAGSAIGSSWGSEYKWPSPLSPLTPRPSPPSSLAPSLHPQPTFIPLPPHPPTLQVQALGRHKLPHLRRAVPGARRCDGRVCEKPRGRRLLEGQRREELLAPRHLLQRRRAV